MSILQYGTVPLSAVEWDPAEIARRLGGQADPESPLYRSCREALRQAVTYRMAYRETEVHLSGEDCDLGFAVIHSHALALNLQGCTHAVILGVTLGSGVDRLITRAYLQSAAEGFLTDGLASAAAESLCDYADCLAGEGRRRVRPRFSPGYGDVPLEVQPDLLRFLQAQTTLGITLTRANFMKPAKSITAILGVCHDTLC